MNDIAVVPVKQSTYRAILFSMELIKTDEFEEVLERFCVSLTMDRFSGLIGYAVREQGEVDIFVDDWLVYDESNDVPVAICPSKNFEKYWRVA